MNLMNKFQPLLVLLTALGAVFLQTSVNGLRWLVGAQVDLLPGLMVYAALTCGPGMVTVVALLGGLWFDSLSANPPGISVLPLLAVGVVIHANRAVILRNQAFAQAVLGLTASGAAPVLAVLLLLTAGQSPLIGWASLWQLGVLALGGAVLTPALFKLLDWVNHSLTYPLAPPPAFRTDREIKRGRV
jgi:rod shape-determining protein MreD